MKRIKIATTAGMVATEAGLSAATEVLREVSGSVAKPTPSLGTELYDIAKLVETQLGEAGLPKAARAGVRVHCQPAGPGKARTGKGSSGKGKAVDAIGVMLERSRTAWYLREASALTTPLARADRIRIMITTEQAEEICARALGRYELLPTNSDAPTHASYRQDAFPSSRSKFDMICTLASDVFDISTVERIAQQLGTGLSADSNRSIGITDDDGDDKLVVTGLFAPHEPDMTLVVCADLEAGIIRGRLLPDDEVREQRETCWNHDLNYCTDFSELDIRLGWRLGVLPIPEAYADLAEECPYALLEAGDLAKDMEVAVYLH